MRTLKITTLLMLCALATGLIAQTAQARQTTVGVKGTLWAEGKGSVNIVGSGSVVLECDGDGIIQIDNYKNATVKIDGDYDKKKRVGDTLFIYKLDGRIKIESATLGIRFDKGKIKLRAHAVGSVCLKGKGKYGLGRGTESWSKKGASLVLIGRIRTIKIKKVECKKIEIGKPEFKKPEIKKRETQKIEIGKIEKKDANKKVETKKPDKKDQHDKRGPEKKSDNKKSGGKDRDRKHK